MPSDQLSTAFAEGIGTVVDSRSLVGMFDTARSATCQLDDVSATFLSFRELRRRGMTRSEIDSSLERGSLCRVRRGRYVVADAHPDVMAAARLGARLDCVSLLRTLKVFVLDRGPLHVQIEHGTSRLPVRPATTVCHWRKSGSSTDSLVTDVIEALAQSCLCQGPRAAIATIDSAWHLGFVDEHGIAQLFERLPRRFRVLRPLLDARSEAGTETLMRLLVRGLGRRVEVQVQIDRVGRVDLLIEGWLIIECDSEEFHASWAAQRRDRRRDAEAAALGYVTLRFIAEDIVHHQEWVRGIVVQTLAHGAPTRPVHNSSRSRRRATKSSSRAGKASS